MTGAEAAAARRRPGIPGLPPGLDNAIRKDVREWLATARGPATLLGVTVFSVMATFGPWLGRQQGRRDPLLPLDATGAFAAAGWLTLLPLVAAFATLSIVTAERDRGTLAWSLSKPLTRNAFLAAKLLTGSGMFILLGLALPMVPAVLAATVAYGSVPDPSMVLWIFLGAAALSIFYITLQVTASVFAWSQAGSVVAVLGAMLASQALVALVPSLRDILPLMIGEWLVRLGRGDVGSPATPLAYLGSVAALVTAARWQLNRVDL